jgi:hypothetical protein
MFSLKILFIVWILSIVLQFFNSIDHRLSINRPTKRGKKKSPSDGQCQCEKEMDDHLMACQQILERDPDTPKQSEHHF